jgi:hypothetical protein
LTCRRCEFLGPAEPVGRDSENIGCRLDVAASRSAMYTTGTPQITFGLA